MNHVVEGLVNVDSKAHTSVGDMLICLSGTGSAKVLDVEPDQAVGRVMVTDFGLRPNPLIATPPRSMLGLVRGTLSDGEFEGARILDTKCSPSDPGVGEELGVEFTTPDGAGAGVRGWKITYEVAGSTEVFVFPLTVFTCPEGSFDDTNCANLAKRVNPQEDS